MVLSTLASEISSCGSGPAATPIAIVVSVSASASLRHFSFFDLFESSALSNVYFLVCGARERCSNRVVLLLVVVSSRATLNRFSFVSSRARLNRSS